MNYRFFVSSSDRFIFGNMCRAGKTYKIERGMAATLLSMQEDGLVQLYKDKPKHKEDSVYTAPVVDVLAGLGRIAKVETKIEKKVETQRTEYDVIGAVAKDMNKKVDAAEKEQGKLVAEALDALFPAEEKKEEKKKVKKEKPVDAVAEGLEL